MQDVRQILKDFTEGLGGLSKSNAPNVQAFLNLQGATYGDSVLPNKVKELISVGIGAYNRCKYCIVFHVYKAYEAGATREEILEAAMVTVGGFGAGPSIAYTSTYLLDAVNEFENDFKK